MGQQMHRLSDPRATRRQWSVIDLAALKTERWEIAQGTVR